MWLLLLRLLSLIGYRLGEVVPGLPLLAGTTAHLSVTNVSDFRIVMYHYFIHFQLVKASAHTILVRTTAVTPVTTMTVGEDAAEDAMMTTGVVVGTTTAGDTVAVIMIVEKGVDMAATVVATTIVADVIMIDGTECGSWQTYERNGVSISHRAPCTSFYPRCDFLHPIFFVCIS
jgi:hypothetical protein